MNKHLPKVFLGVVISSMAGIGISIAINQPKFDIIDISGKKENIGDVKIISQSNESIYTNHENILSKDGFEVKPYAKMRKEVLINEEIIQLDEEFFEECYDINTVFKNGDNIGFLSNEYIYESDKITLNYTLKTKDIKTNKEEKYMFTSPQKLNPNSNFEKINYLITKGNDIFLVELGVKDIEYGNNGEYISNGDSHISIYKVNLDTNELEKYNEVILKANEEDIVLSSDISFKYENKCYFTINKKDKSGKVDSYICYYDLDKNECSYIEEPINLLKENTDEYLKYDLYKYSLDNDILQIVSNDKNNNNTMEINQISIDLKNNKVLAKNNIYNVERLYKKTAVSSARSIDGKLYVILSNMEPTRKDKDKNNSIVVLDENTKKVLYMGQYKEDPASGTGHLILKDSEI